MLTIRLQRLGKKNYPTYRLIVSEKARDTQGNNLEILGSYDPHKEDGFQPKADRVTYWLSKGAQLSNTVHNLLLKAGIITGAKPKRSVYISRDRAKKLAEEQKAKQPAAEDQPPAPAASA